MSQKAGETIICAPHPCFQTVRKLRDNMHYAVSDLHGNYDKYQALLGELALGPQDVLYVLGNVLGRGASGLRILRELAARENTLCLLGRQEFAAMVCLPWLDEELTQNATRQEVLAARLRQVLAWKNDGGGATMDEFAALPPLERMLVLDDLAALPLYAEAEAAGKSFVLVHAGLSNFSPKRPLKDYRIDELVLSPPDPDKTYFPDRYLVFGHTPTPLLFAHNAGRPPSDFPPQIFRKGRLIGIDCGSAYGGKLGCICLETFQEFYV